MAAASTLGVAVGCLPGLTQAAPFGLFDVNSTYPLEISASPIQIDIAG
jgi:hypothetical protein